MQRDGYCYTRGFSHYGHYYHPTQRGREGGYTVATTTGGTPVYTTVVKNTYVTNNPTTIIREGGSASTNTSGISASYVLDQIEAAVTTLSDNIQDVYESIATSVTTALLAVTGNASIGGNLSLTGSASFSNLLTVGGTVTAGNFVATTTTATSTLAGGFTAASSLYVLQNGNVGVGTSSPDFKFTVENSSGIAAIKMRGTSSVVPVTIEWESAADGFAPGADGNFGASLDTRAFFGTSGYSKNYNRTLNFFSHTLAGTYSFPFHIALDTVGLTQKVAINPGSNMNEGLVSILGSATSSEAISLGNNSTGDILRVTGAAVERLRITGAGNVGVGTSTPFATIQIATTTGKNLALTDTGAGTNLKHWLFSSMGGNLYIGTTTDALATSSLSVLTVLNNGRVGIASTSPWKTLGVTGTVGFDGLTGTTGAGSLCLTASKEVVYNAGSDACLSSTRATKHNITNLSLDGAVLVLALKPVSFIYNNDASSTIRYGFIAEDAASVDEHFATRNQNGEISGIDDRSIIAILVKTVQGLLSTVSGFAQSLTTNVLMAVTGNFEKVCIKKSDGTSVCVTGDELGTLLNQSGQSPIIITDVPQPALDPTPESSTTTESAPPSDSTQQIP